MSDLIRRPRFQLTNMLTWEDKQEGPNVEIVKGSDGDVISGYDVYRVSKRDKDSFDLIATIDNKSKHLIDSGSKDSFLARENSSHENVPFEEQYSILNDDSVTTGFQYDDMYKYVVIPSPTVSLQYDLYGRRKLSSDVRAKPSRNVITKDINAPSKVKVDSYIVNPTFVNPREVYVYFHPLNGQGVGPVFINKEKKEGFYRVSSSMGYKTEIMQPAINNRSIKNPAIFGSDIQLRYLDRNINLAFYSTRATSPESKTITNKITAYDFENNKSEDTKFEIDLTQIKMPSPMVVKRLYGRRQGILPEQPRGLQFSWVLVGSGEEIREIEVYRGSNNEQLERLGTFEASVEQVELAPGIIDNVYTWFDFSAVLDAPKQSKIYTYAFRFRGPDGMSVTHFQEQYTDDLVNAFPRGVIRFTLEPRNIKNPRKKLLPGIPPEQIRKRSAALTRSKFVIAALANADRDIPIVIYEPSSGLFIERTYSLRKVPK